ncbi:Endoglucanase-5 [Dactylella cylindrospora]|nr:Endoglucanase-5 [Dactylella cylindrospora]
MALRFFSSLLVGASLLTSLTTADTLSGESFTSMYYDCCKPACAWPTQGDFLSGLKTCDANNELIRDDTAGNYCGGGPASSCINQTPWAVNDSFSYGYASIFIRGADSTEWCCSCYELEFLDSDIKGKKMIVQGINVNYNEDQINWFSLTVPGQADWRSMCEQRFGGTFGEFFGANSTGLTNVTQCDDVPEELQAACRWRYTWYMDVEGPNATFTRVQCPAELTDVSGCVRADDNKFAASPSTAGTVISTQGPASPLVIFTVVILLFLAFPSVLEYL